jgi:hypothetical protein
VAVLFSQQNRRKQTEKKIQISKEPKVIRVAPITGKIISKIKHISVPQGNCQEMVFGDGYKWYSWLLSDFRETCKKNNNNVMWKLTATDIHRQKDQTYA